MVIVTYLIPVNVFLQPRKAFLSAMVDEYGNIVSTAYGRTRKQSRKNLLTGE